MKTWLYSAVAASALILSASAQGQSADEWAVQSDIPSVSDTILDAEPGTIEAEVLPFYTMGKVSDASVSPDGTRIAYKTDVTGQPDVWLVPASGGKVRQLTKGGVRSYAWAPAGDGLVVRTDSDGNERDTFSFVSAEDGATRSLEGAGAAFSAFGDFSSDGKSFMFASTARNGDDYDLYVQPMKGGAASRVFEGRFGWTAQSWQPGGPYVIVTETRGEDGCDLFVFNTSTNTMVPLYQPKVSSNFEAFEWTKDGAGFYMASNMGRNYQALSFYDLKTGELTVLEAPDADIDAISLGGDDRYIAWLTNEGGFSKLSVRDLKVNRLVELPPLPRGVYSIEIAKSAPVLKLHISSPQIPGDVWTYNFETKALTRVTDTASQALNLSQMAVPESVTFKARDGVDLYGLLYMPPQTALAEGEKPPIILEVHGGPTAQARPEFWSDIQLLVSRGYAVLDLNFRGSTGYGKTFARLDNQTLRPNAVRDIQDAMEWLKQTGKVDTARAGVKGASYGGYLVNAVLGEFPNLFKAGVSRVGVSDWVRALEEASPALKASDRLEYGDISDPKVREFHAKISPLAKAGDIKTPVLVQHGANDPRDPVTESDRFVAAIRSNGGAAEYVRLADEGHSIRKVANKVYWASRMAAFLDTHLKDAPSDVSAQESKAAKPTPDASANTMAEAVTTQVSSEAKDQAATQPTQAKETAEKKTTAVVAVLDEKTITPEPSKAVEAETPKQALVTDSAVISSAPDRARAAARKAKEAALAAQLAAEKARSAAQVAAKAEKTAEPMKAEDPDGPAETIGAAPAVAEKQAPAEPEMGVSGALAAIEAQHSAPTVQPMDQQLADIQSQAKAEADAQQKAQAAARAQQEKALKDARTALVEAEAKAKSATTSLETAEAKITAQDEAIEVAKTDVDAQTAAIEAAKKALAKAEKEKTASQEMLKAAQTQKDVLMTERNSLRETAQAAASSVREAKAKVSRLEEDLGVSSAQQDGASSLLEKAGAVVDTVIDKIKGE